MLIVMILIAIIVILAMALISQKLAVEACVAWMVENNYNIPTNEDAKRLVGWCVRKHLGNLLGKA